MLRTNCRGRTKSLRAIRWLLIQIRDGGGLDESSGGLDGKAWSDSGCILKAEPMVLNYGLDVGSEIIKILECYMKECGLCSEGSY